MTLPYKQSDWPKSKRRTYDSERISKRRAPPLTPIEQWIEGDKRKEKELALERPFNDPLPW